MARTLLFRGLVIILVTGSVGYKAWSIEQSTLASSLTEAAPLETHLSSRARSPKTTKTYP